MAYSGSGAISFAQGKIGRYGDGECWTLVEDAVVGAGGKSSRVLTPGFGPNSSYVWGTVIQTSALRAGDVLQFSNYKWTRSITVDVTNPDGSGPVDTTSDTKDRGAPQHSAIVVSAAKGVVEIVEQNIPGGSGPVQTLTLLLVAGAPNVVTTTRAGPKGPIVTVTTTTDTVQNPPRCYRPISA